MFLKFDFLSVISLLTIFGLSLGGDIIAIDQIEVVIDDGNAKVDFFVQELGRHFCFLTKQVVNLYSEKTKRNNVDLNAKSHFSGVDCVDETLEATFGIYRAENSTTISGQVELLPHKFFIFRTNSSSALAETSFSGIQDNGGNRRVLSNDICFQSGLKIMDMFVGVPQNAIDQIGLQDTLDLIEQYVTWGNMIYRRYLNAVIRLAGSEIVNIPCDGGYANYVYSFRDYFGEETGYYQDYAFGVLFAMCDFGGVGGAATTAALCNSDMGPGLASGFTRVGYNIQYPVSFMHEVGHILGAEHPFDIHDGAVGSFGGIMDYGTNGKLQNGSLGFTDETMGVICPSLANAVESCGSVVYYADESNCGDGVIENDEECECAEIGQTNCEGCTDCQLVDNSTQCSDTLIMLIQGGPLTGTRADADCCVNGYLKDAMDGCVFKDADDGSDVPGYCVAGKCKNLCSLASENSTTLCGLVENSGGCHQKCQTADGYCGGDIGYLPEVNNIDNKDYYPTRLNSGALCVDSASGYLGNCNEYGTCIVQSSNPTTKSPTTSESTSSSSSQSILIIGAVSAVLVLFACVCCIVYFVCCGSTSYEEEEYYSVDENSGEI